MQNGDENFNTSLDMTFENDLNNAIQLSKDDLDYHSILNFLKNGSIMQRQIAALQFNEINSSEDARLLVNNLTGQDGKVREAVAYKLNQLTKNENFIDYFFQQEIYDTLLNGLMDINGNVARNVVEIVCTLRQNKDFCEYFSQRLMISIEKLLIKARETEILDKSYLANKRNFQLYWCLESIYDFVEYSEEKALKAILEEAGAFYDYTIREKIARILTQDVFNTSDYQELKNKLKNDENYFVRRFLE